METKLQNLDIEVNLLKDTVWRLTGRVFILEDFIRKKFGDVLLQWTSGIPTTQTSTVSIGSGTAASNMRSFKETELVDEAAIPKSQRNTSPVSARPRSSRRQSGSRNDNLVDHEDDASCKDDDTNIPEKNEFRLLSPKREVPELVETSSNDDNQCQKTENDPDFVLPFETIEDSEDESGTQKKYKKFSWTLVQQFPNKETAEDELAKNLWRKKTTSSITGGKKILYYCKHSPGKICPAGALLHFEDNKDTVSFYINDVEHIHEGGGPRGLPYEIKKLISSMVNENRTTKPSVVLEKVNELNSDAPIKRYQVTRYLHLCRRKAQKGKIPLPFK